MISTLCAPRRRRSPPPSVRTPQSAGTRATPRCAWHLALLGGLVLSACSVQPIAEDGRLLGVVTPYRIDIVEGNVVTREQAALVRPGMTRAQVRDLLGSPMLTDPFHADRWDYFFTFRRGGEPVQRRSVVAHFEGDALARLEVPATLPSEQEFVAAIDPPSRRLVPPPALELTAEQRAALPTPSRAAPAVSVPSGAARTYPPLESR